MDERDEIIERMRDALLACFERERRFMPALYRDSVHDARLYGLVARANALLEPQQDRENDR